MGNDTNSSKGSGSRRLVIGALALLLIVVTVIVLQTIEHAPVAGGPGGPKGSGQMPPAAVIVKPIVQEITREEAIVTGTLKAVSEAKVAARESGAITEVLVNEGDEVNQGGPLARLDSRRLNAMLTEANARLTSARNLLEQRTAELRRAEEDLKMKSGLLASRAVSESDVLDAEKLLAVTRAQENVARDGIAEAGSRIELLKVQLDDLTIAAPFTGVIVDRRVEPGEHVVTGGVVATMVAMDPIEAWLRVPARYLGNTELSAASFRVRQSSTGRLFEPAKVEKIPHVEPLSQLFAVVATIPNAKCELTPGESVTGIVPVGARRGFWKIPGNAIVQSPMGDVVYVVQPPAGEGAMPTGRSVPVSIAFEREGNAFIAAESGKFKEGDQVVVEGNERLMPGQSLIIKPTGEAPARSAP